MWHPLSFVAESRRVDPVALKAFALANEDKYGIATDCPEPEVNTWHVDLLVADFKNAGAMSLKSLRHLSETDPFHRNPGDRTISFIRDQAAQCDELSPEFWHLAWSQDTNEKTALMAFGA